MTNTFWQPKNKLSIWAIHNDDGDLGKDITFEETKGKRLIGHSAKEDIYEDTKGKTYSYKEKKSLKDKDKYFT